MEVNITQDNITSNVDTSIFDAMHKINLIPRTELMNKAIRYMCSKGLDFMCSSRLNVLPDNKQSSTPRCFSGQENIDIVNWPFRIMGSPSLVHSFLGQKVGMSHQKYDNLTQATGHKTLSNPLQNVIPQLTPP